MSSPNWNVDTPPSADPSVGRLEHQRIGIADAVLAVSGWRGTKTRHHYKYTRAIGFDRQLTGRVGLQLDRCLLLRVTRVAGMQGNHVTRHRFAVEQHLELRS